MVLLSGSMQQKIIQTVFAKVPLSKRNIYKFSLHFIVNTTLLFSSYVHAAPYNYYKI
ncbi:hypothetical protein AHMF7616_01554 [Adhaeribacter pallidiroseus]|uniref:Uncharacterized protein n=1 Tax=Adhaeribacter pallidiroseus TaxID=2072847 RepID=A0A369QHA8_9BACT|nr:hypothetical protein AHMF7616_01554 [Adhaeribacter pallidiroseus]